MNRETYEALQASIEKWKRNAEVTSTSDGLVSWLDCPLCDLFYRDVCENCPIREAVGLRDCRRTPYPEAVAAVEADNLPAFRKAAQAEVEFLQALVPAGGPEDA